MNNTKVTFNNLPTDVVNNIMSDADAYIIIKDYDLFKMFASNMSISYVHIDAAVLHNDIEYVKYLLNNGGDKYISYYAIKLAKQTNEEIYNLLKEACINWDADTECNCRRNGNYYLQDFGSKTYRVFMRLECRKCSDY